jgi:hypothetical protein
MGLPHTVHLVFSKNWNSLQRLFSHFIMMFLPHASQFPAPTKVCPLQNGQAIISCLPHPVQSASPFFIGFRHAGQFTPNGDLLAHFEQKRLSRSSISPQLIQGCL